MSSRTIVWPKTPPPLSEDEVRINDDWNRYWFEINRGKYSRTIDFGHRYVVNHSPAGFVTTLDVGAGLGEQLQYERLTPEQMRNYVCLERRETMIAGLRERWPAVQIADVDCTRRMPFPDAHFDRILAIHVLEHLADLPAFLDEAVRLLSPGGRLMMIIPCEGGLAYAAGRRVTSQRLFEKRYGLPYGRFIRAEHVNQAWEVLTEVRRRFRVEHQSWFPFAVPSIHMNFVAAMTLAVR